MVSFFTQQEQLYQTAQEYFEDVEQNEISGLKRQDNSVHQVKYDLVTRKNQSFLKIDSGEFSSLFNLQMLPCVQAILLTITSHFIFIIS